MLSLGQFVGVLLVCFSGMPEGSEPASPPDLGGTGPYTSLERIDAKRVIMRVARTDPLPVMDDEIMLDELENWKWRVEMSAAGAAILVTFSQCPHGLGLLPPALGWQGGGRWRLWPGTFQFQKGALSPSVKFEWKQIDAAKACGGSGATLDSPQEAADEASCKNLCDHRSGCMAVDFYKDDKTCQLFERPCLAATDGQRPASSWKRHVTPGKGQLEAGEFTYVAAKQWCQQVASCTGFTFNGTWPDKEREGGVSRWIHFSSEAKLHEVDGSKGDGSVTIQVGDSPQESKKCTPIEKGLKIRCDANAANKGRRVNKDFAEYGDSFRVDVVAENGTVCVTRIDADRGWEMKLAVQCMKADANWKSGTRWSSYMRKDNPRAECNPDGAGFDCPDNPYACLGLSIDADDGAIKQAYRALSKQMHPDKLKDRSKEAVKQAEAAFREIAESHETLMSPKTRRETNQHLQRRKQKWVEEKASVQDIYIKEPKVASLEPESYPVLIPKGQEWLVHFYLPQNDGCKQMKMAMLRVVGDLGIGDEERGDATRRPLRPTGQFKTGDIYRGVFRPKTTDLKTEGGAAREGDEHMFLEVSNTGVAKVYIGSDDNLRAGVEVALEEGSKNEKGRLQTSFTLSSRIFTGRFDGNLEWFRGTVAETSDPKNDVSSFALQVDLLMDPPQRIPSKNARTKPRLFGAVNCGRFAEFCKRKGADPSFTKRFPQVRMLFPDENRFEVYRGRAVGKEVFNFAREASRARGDVRQLNVTDLAELRKGSPTFWIILLLNEVSAKVAMDCQLCRTALPALRRSAIRLAGSGVQTGWVNCTADAELAEEERAQSSLCASLADADDKVNQWGSLWLLEIGQREPEQNADATPQLYQKATKLIDGDLLVGDLGQQGMVAALEGAARMAELLASSSVVKDAPEAKSEL